MSDNVTFQTAVTATPPNATAIATDQISGAHHQLVKVEFGDDGTAYVVSAGTPFPVILYGSVAGSVYGLGTFQTIGTAQLHGTAQVGSVQRLAGGTLDAFGGTLGGGTVSLFGTSHIGSIQRLAGGTLDSFGGTFGGGTFSLAGTAHIGSVQRIGGGTIDSFGGTLGGGSVSLIGTSHVGSIQRLAGGTLDAFGGTLGGGTVSLFGTSHIGSIQRLAGGTIDSFGGTLGGGSVSLIGTSHIGSVQRLAGGTLDAFGGTIGGGTVWLFGTGQFLGTVQALSTMLFGSVQGWRAHGQAIGGNPILIGVQGSSGEPAAVTDGLTVRLWADLNGRLQVRGTIDSMPAVTITAGTVSLNTGGTAHIGSVQRIAGGTIDSFGGTIGGGTVQLAGTVPTRTAAYPFGSYFGTSITAAATNGTLIAPLGQGTRWRLFDLTVSASAAGTIVFQEAASGSVVFGPLFFAANGGMVLASAQGLRARGTNLGLFCTNSAGTMSVTVNYFLETP